MSFFRPENLRTLAAGQWLQRPPTDDECVGVGIDTRDDLAGRVFIAIKGANHDGHGFLHQAATGGARLLMVEREIEISRLPRDVGVMRVDDTRRCLVRLASNYRDSLASTKVIAVTGSSGKTTTRRLVHHVLSSAMRGSEAPKSFNNDIGVPLTLLAAQPGDRYVLVEIGTSAPGEISQLAAIARPDIAVITMIGRAHLEKLGSVEGVAREKASLLFHLKEGGAAIVTADSPQLREYVRPLPSVILFGRAPDADLRLTGRGRQGEGWWFEINGRARFRLGLGGEHNAVNAIAVVAVARRMGLTDERIDAALASAQPAPMRMTRLTIGSIDLYNDAYNANPDSMQASLAAFGELAESAPRRIVILGDMLELGDAAAALHREVGAAIVALDKRIGIDRAVLIGRFAADTAAPLEAWGADRIKVVRELTAQVGADVAELLRPGDSVLLKASRGSAVERLIEHIQRRHSGGGGGGGGSLPSNLAEPKASGCRV